MDKIKIGFLGYGTMALTSLIEHPLYEVKYFIVPSKRLCQDVYNAMEEYKNQVKIIIVSNHAELLRVLMEIKDVECFLMNACPIILKQDVLDCMDFYNIHPGDLSYNRGHHPHLWTVLLGEKKSKITIHKVNTEIDTGEVIGSVEVTIKEDENAEDVLNKLEYEIPVLLDVLYEYRRNEAPFEGIILNGGYRRKMEHRDYEIDVETDNLAMMERKIRARSMHHGAFINKDGIRYYVDRIKKIYTHTTNTCAVYSILFLVDQGNKEVFLDTREQMIIFHLNKTEKVDWGESL